MGRTASQCSLSCKLGLVHQLFLSYKPELTYTEYDGYQYPGLTLLEQEDVVIGRFGQRHKRYLKKSRRLVYFRLLTSGKLSSYLAEVDQQAQDMFETIVNQTKKVHGITEELKADNPMQWVQEMNSIINMAEEFVNQELIYR